jgi:hypothetical protein
LLSLAALGFFPIAIALIQGQDTILLLLISVLCLVFLDQKRDVAAGAVLAIGLFKFHLIAPLVVLLAIRRPRLLTGFLPVAAVFAGVSVAMLGWDGAARYVQFVLHLEKSGAGAIVSDMPNLRGLIAVLPRISAAAGLTTLLSLVLSAAVFVIALQRMHRDSLSSAFALAALTSILISYHTLAYDLSLLFPGAVFLFAGMRDARNISGRAAVLPMLLLFFTPLYVLLWLHLDRLCWLALVLVWLFVALARTRAVTERPA